MILSNASSLREADCLNSLGCFQPSACCLHRHRNSGNAGEPGELHTHNGEYMERGLASCVNVLDILEKIAAFKTYLLPNHAVSGCDSISVLFGNGKKTVLHKVKESFGNNSYIEAFINIDNKKEEIAAAG